MEKNWLIRTIANQILGPVSKEKIVEFLEKGALSPNDELTSGNGYWFYIREKDLLESYIYGDRPQDFNPVSEAPSVLTAGDAKKGLSIESLDDDITLVGGIGDLKDKLEEQEDEVHLPSNEDLEYPDMDSLSEVDDITQVASAPTPVATPTPEPAASSNNNQNSELDLSTEELDFEDDEEAHLPNDEDLEYPDMGMAADESPSVEEVAEPDIAVEEEAELSAVDEESPVEESNLDSELFDIPEEDDDEDERPARTKRKTKKSDDFLFYGGIVTVIGLLAVYFYYKRILTAETFINNSFLISTAQAQEPTGYLVKKKSLLALTQ